jgi:hypothetical protein
MIIALLVCLAATVTTGLMGYGEQSKGPLAAVLVTDAKANGKPRALNFPSIKKSAWAAASKLSELSGFVRLAAGVLRGKQDEKSASIRMRKCRRMRDEGRA